MQKRLRVTSYAYSLSCYILRRYEHENLVCQGRSLSHAQTNKMRKFFLTQFLCRSSYAVAMSAYMTPMVEWLIN